MVSWEFFTVNLFNILKVLILIVNVCIILGLVLIIGLEQFGLRPSSMLLLIY